MQSKPKAHLAVLITNFLFGINYASIKFLTPTYIHPIALNMARVITAFVLFWLLYFIKPSTAGIRKKDIPRFIVCAATGVVLNQLLFVKGLSLTTTIHASLLALATPIFITFIAAWLLKEKLNLQKIIGLILGVGGASLLILLKDHSVTASDMFLGDIFVLMNAVLYAFYMVLVRPLMNTYSPVHVVRWVFTFGLIVLIPFTGSDFVSTNWSGFSGIHWAVLALVCIGATFVTYLFNVYGISIIGASATGSYIYTQPIFAAIVAMLLMGEHITIYKIISATLIFVGVYLVNFKKTLK